MRSHGSAGNGIHILVIKPDTEEIIVAKSLSSIGSILDVLENVPKGHILALGICKDVSGLAGFQDFMRNNLGSIKIDHFENKDSWVYIVIPGNSYIVEDLTKEDDLITA